MNCRKLKCCDFCKGTVYAIYLSPTYVNIFTIYSIANIHDVTWGSRPTTQDNALKDVELKKDMIYKNYRAKFLIFWALLNIFAGSVLIYLFDNGNVQLIFYIGIFLVIVMFFRILFAMIYKCKAKCDRVKVRHRNRKRRSNIFEGVEKEPMDDKEDIFVVFYDNDGGNMRISHKDDPAFRQSNIRSSVLDQNIFRGFSVVDINTKHRVSQGLDDMRISKKTINRPIREETINQLFMSDSSSSIKDSISDINMSPISPKNSKSSNTKEGEGNTKMGKEMSVNFKREVLKRKSRKGTVKVKFEDDREPEIGVPFSGSISSEDEQERPDTPSDISEEDSAILPKGPVNTVDKMNKNKAGPLRPSGGDDEDDSGIDDSSSFKY